MALAEMENASDGEEGGCESDVVAHGCILAAFSDSAETRGLIAGLPEAYEDTKSREAAIQRFVCKLLKSP